MNNLVILWAYAVLFLLGIQMPVYADAMGGGVSPSNIGMMRVITTGSTVQVNTNDYFIVINKTIGSPTTVNLPTSPIQGEIVVIKDGKGDAGTNVITISPGSGTIDNSSNYLLNNNFGAISLSYNSLSSMWNVF